MAYDPFKPTARSLLTHFRTVAGIAAVCAAGAAYWGATTLSSQAGKLKGSQHE